MAEVVFDTGVVGVQQPSIKLDDVFCPAIRSEESHDALLSYLKERLMQGNRERLPRLKRMMNVDKMISTWQKLSDEDTQRKNKQEATGQAQAITMNLPLADSHLEDMVSFFAGVYSPAASDFFQMPDTSTQPEAKPLVVKLNSDAKAQKYYKNLCMGIRSMLKYNIGGYAVNWVDAASEEEMYNGNDGMNRISSVDMYNVMWDPTVKDPAKIRDNAEWAAQIDIVNAKTLVKLDRKQVYYGTYCCLETPGMNGKIASWYKYPPNFAGINGEDDKTSLGRNNVDWASYGLALESEEGIHINGHERVEMYCWLNPHDFKLADPADPKSPLPDPNDYVLWRFVIIDGKRIVSAAPVPSDDDESHPARKVGIPFFLGYMKQDDMGAAQRSIAELLMPFQTFASFLLNSHVAATRSKIWGIQAYDPSMFDMGQLQPGQTTARIASKLPGRDVRTGLITLNADTETSNIMEELAKLMALVKEFFPAQALPSQIAGMDRAVTNQVQAVLQGVNRRLHMLVRVVDDDIMGPMRMQAYVNIARFQAISLGGLADADAERVLGSGIAQLNRDAAAQAIQQLLFALIQAPQAGQQIDILKLMNYWSSLINITVDLTDFVRQPDVAATPPGPGQNGQQAAPAGVDPNAPQEPVA